MEYVVKRIETDELQHHGTKGQKWGVRRYQNADGSLTLAGKLRYGQKADGTLTDGGKKRYKKDVAKLRAEEKVVKNREATAAKLKKLSDKRTELDEREAALDGPKKEKKHSDDGDAKAAKAKLDLKKNKPKKLSEMNDEELAQAIRRLEMEKRFNDLSPKEVEEGNKFVKDIGEKLKSTALYGGEKLLKSAIDKGIKEFVKEEPSEIEKLKKQYDKAKLQKDLADLKKSESEYSKLKEEYDMAKLKKDMENLNKPDIDVDSIIKDILDNAEGKDIGKLANEAESYEKLYNNTKKRLEREG